VTKQILILTAVFLASPASADASPRPLPFTYGYPTLPAAALEVEQYVDITPIRVERIDPDGTRAVIGHRYELQTELEYGLTDRLEGALYFAFQQGASSQNPTLRFQGLKQRLRYRFAEPDVWPLDLGVYVELAEFHDEVELEQKLLVSKRFGRFQAAANLWFEAEYYFQEEDWKYIYNPTAGISAELSPNFHLGMEYWARGRFDKSSAYDAEVGLVSRTRHYAGPTFLMQRGKHFLSLGSYLRLDNLSRSTLVNDPFGRVWFRVLLGIDL
jgi:hypothetical protein